MWIQFRERLLNKITSVGETQVLNSGEVVLSHQVSVGLAGELKQAINAMLALAGMDKQGNLDYQALRESEEFQRFQQELSPCLRDFNPQTLRTRDEKIAFWINLYNVLVLDGVIHLGIRNSVIEGKLGNFSFFKRVAYNIRGIRISLEDIEHGILRANRGHPYLPGKHFAPKDPRSNWVIYPLEPRIHFALNCASRSCPPIGVYEARNLDKQLEIAARNFLTANVHVDKKKCRLSVSSIFKWFKSDFGGKKGVIKFIETHLPDDGRRQYIHEHSKQLDVRFQSYDWGLNRVNKVTPGLKDIQKLSYS